VGLAACDAASPVDDAPLQDEAGGKADDARGGDEGVRGLHSREYKVMLDAAAFAGADPVPAVHGFWDELVAVTEDIGRHTKGEPDDVRERTVAVFDTDGCTLRSSGWVLRRRVEDAEAEVTLKARSLDRLIVATTEVEPRSKDWEMKFEEDIVAPFVSTYSLSTTVEAGEDPRLESMDDLRDLFDAKDLEDVEGDLTLVGDTVYHERAFKGGKLDLGHANAKVTITLWWLPDQPAAPVVAEASFKIEAEDDAFERKIVQRANELFERMQALDPWVAPDATTKTALVYARAGDLCEG
jgi:hypothetical protein